MNRENRLRSLFGAGACGTCFFIVCAVHGGAARQPVAQFRAGIVGVRVDVVVIDEQGRPVTDLSKDDSRLFEDGQRQELTEIVLVDRPLPPEAQPAPAAAAGDVVSNDSIARDGRLIVLVLDDLQTLVGREDIVRRAGTRLIEGLPAGDLLAVLCTSGIRHCACDFTTDRTLLLASLAGFQGRKTRFDREDSIHGPPVLLQSLGKAFGQLDSIKTLKTVVRQLGAVRNRRKAVVYLGEGVDADLRSEPLRTGPGFRFDEAG